MYTADGNDRIRQENYSKNIYIADFGEKDDKLVFTDTMPFKWAHPVKIASDQWFSNDGANAIPLNFYHRQVVLESVEGEGFDEETVKGWVSIADGSYRETEEGQELSVDYWLKMQSDNPIQITK